MIADDYDWSDVTTAEDVAVAREMLMVWSEHTGDLDATAGMSDALTARAVELGLETHD
jgi:hypothetical protein